MKDSPKPTLTRKFKTIKVSPAVNFTSVDKADLILARNSFIQPSGFKFCSILDNALFDPFVSIFPLGGTVAQMNPDVSVFINLIDASARDIFNSILARYPFSNLKELLRSACYLAAEGNTPLAGISHSRLLVSIEPVNYLKSVLPAIVPNPLSNRRRFKIAYLIMAHEYRGLRNLVWLIELLDDGDAIILVHVDSRPKSNQLYQELGSWIRARRATSNAYLAKNRFCNIWGHSSLVFTQLSGFWELLDMADWDFVINLSNYDYPLKSNSYVHQSLANVSMDTNWIEYWSENTHLAERLHRVHIGKADFSSVFSPEETGMISPPFPRWTSWKHHQWMILTPKAVAFLRKDSEALTYLAFCEHTYIPDENYFATALLNSPLKDTVKNNNRRYLRFSLTGAHPSWLGYDDRFFFPANENEPSFFFIRKFNVYGKVFKEDLLVEWIREKHVSNPILEKCTLEDVSVSSRCLVEFTERVATKKEVIVIPVSSKYLENFKNLVCSLKLLKITNIIAWSLDHIVHKQFLDRGQISVFLPGFPFFGDVKPEDTRIIINKLLQYKAQVLLKFVENGYNVWYFDADSVILKDFRDIVQNGPDIFLAKPASAILTVVKNAAKLNTATMYFRASKLAKDFLGSVIENSRRPYDTYTEDYVFQLVLNQNPTYQKQIGLFDPNVVVSGHDLFEEDIPLPKDLYNPVIIHVNPQKNSKVMLSQWGLWLLEQDGRCSELNLKTFSHKLSRKVRI